MEVERKMTFISILFVTLQIQTYNDFNFDQFLCTLYIVVFFFFFIFYRAEKKIKHMAKDQKNKEKDGV